MLCSFFVLRVYLTIASLLLQGIHSKVRHGHRMHPKVRHAMRVVGGEEINISKYPYIVEIERWIERFDEWLHACTGSALTTKVILTACHCIADVSEKGKPLLRAAEHIRVLAGITNIIEPPSNVQKIGAAKLVIHPECIRGAVMENDVGVIELENELELSEGQVALLPIFSIIKEEVLNEWQTLEQAETECSALGWGRTGPGGSGLYSETLKEATLNLIPGKEACKARLCESDQTNCDTDFSNINQVCAARQEVNTCEGDSGSPLVCNNNVFGILSWGDGDCTVETPNVFASVEPTWYFINQYRN